MAKQTWTRSAFEQTVNIATGFLLSYAVWRWGIAPAIDHGYLEYSDAFTITVIFTVVSWLRGFGFRRLFNWLDHRGREA